MKLLLAFAALMAGVSAKPGTIRKIDSAQGAFAIDFDFDFGSCFALIIAVQLIFSLVAKHT